MGGADEDHRNRDAISALVNLGYSQRDAQRAVSDVWAEASGDDLGEVLRRALQKLTR
jgi:Holliday junction resolvasome RuvABC DNA-binding subunit